MYSRIDVHLWVIDQCYVKPWDPCISTGSYRPKVYLWSSEVYWKELPCAHGSKRPCLVVPEISADQCPALINWYLDEYWLLWHVLGIVQKVFQRAFRCILDHGNHASIRGVIGQMKFVTSCLFPTNFLYLVSQPWACSKCSRVLERFFGYLSNHSQVRLCHQYHSSLFPTLLIPLLNLPLLSLLFLVYISQVLLLPIPSRWHSAYPRLVLLYLDCQSGLMHGLWYHELPFISKSIFIFFFFFFSFNYVI